jgi:hypothetical protein
MSTIAHSSNRLSLNRILLAGVIAIVASVIANLIVRWLGLLVVESPPDFQPLASVAPTIIFTTLFLVIATAIFALINRFAGNPLRTFTVVAIVALLLGLVPDIMLLVNPEAIGMGTPSLGAVLILILMHFVAFYITMWVFTRWAPQA